MNPPATSGRRAHPPPSARLFILSAAALFLSGPSLTSAAPGDLDPGLNATGLIFTSIGQECTAYSLVIQPDGKIITASLSRVNSSTPSDIALVRHFPDGTVDASFGEAGNGIVTTRLGITWTFPQGTALQPDGKILVAGTMTPSSGNRRIYALRYHPDGRLDTAFGGTGLLSPAPGADCMARDIAIQSDGKIILAGSAGTSANTQHSAIFRFMPDGTPDAGFNGTGTVLTSLGNVTDAISAIALQHDGKIVVAGNATTLDSSVSPSVRSELIALARYLPDGRLDPDFNSTGILLTNPGNPPSLSWVNCVAVHTDGKIVAGGAMQNSCALLRLDSLGRPDPSFNGTGHAVYPLPGTRSVLNGLAVDHAGRIVATGVNTPAPNTTTAVVLGVLPDGSLDPLFHGDGVVTNNFDSPVANYSAAVIEPAGTLLAAGGRGTTFKESVLARFQLWSGFTVEQPARSPLANNSPQPVDFGLVALGTRFREFTVRNHGQTPLTGLTISLLQQSHPGEFIHTAPSLTTLPPYGTSTFTVTFTPSAAPGPRTATLQVRLLDPDERLFTIPLTGGRATPLEVWRYTWFGSYVNSGPGADLNDFDRDGLTNLVEYSLGTHPHQSSPLPLTTILNGPVLELTYTRPVATLTEITCQPQSAPTPDGPWSPDGITTTILTDNSLTQTLKALIPATTSPLFVRLHITRH